TFDLVWLAAWAPHESQPKPLKPGSATARLADALKRRS
ncbi:MAG: SAM-dependent methyltransferase, partial [Roseiarcus sp.]